MELIEYISAHKVLTPYTETYSKSTSLLKMAYIGFMFYLPEITSGAA